ncbi:MAG: putative quinol monooxygenase [Proteobacteria bacterium]|nr:putative quinol monooxygenase [Pseudomonadota bacterium]
MALVHTAHLTCRQDALELFKWRLEQHAQITLDAESGCHRFDVYQSSENPALFFLFEVYADQAALDLHRASPHYLKFRADTADWVSERKWWFWRAFEPRQS